jgi:hypothetical protein
MKTNVPLRNYFRFLFACAATFTLLCTAQPSYAGQLHQPGASVRDTILINKTLTSKKHKIRLYANADNSVIFFTASGEPGRVYQLYLFDVDGKLNKQIQIRNKETTVLTNIIKGSYLFEVFSDDERIENGQLVVR